LDGLRAEAAPLTLIVWALADATRQLYRIAFAISAGQAVPQAVKAQRAPLGRERLLERAAQRLSAAELQAIVQLLAQGDKMAKGIPVPGHADCWQLLASALQRLASTPKNRRPR
jgi:DNA polymerase-3 subunit delta